jgi:hypothetical protein
MPMRKTMTTAALAAMLAVAGPAAFAADMTPDTSAAPAVHGTVTATRIEPGQILATALQGADIYDSQNKSIATVADIILDPGGRVAAVVAKVDGKYVGLAMRDLDITTDNNKPHIAVNMSEDQLKSAQTFQLETKAAGSGGSMPPAALPTPTSRRQ